MKIVLLHPENLQRQVLQFMLEQAGFEVHVVTGLSRLRREILSSRPTCLIALEDGEYRQQCELFGELRELEFDGPILVLAPEPNVDSELLAFQSGADDYMGSPVDPTVLIARLTRINARTARDRRRSARRDAPSHSRPAKDHTGNREER